MSLTTIPYSMTSADVASAIVASSATAKSEAIAAASVKLTGDVVQVINTQTGALATGTTIIPFDDTIPQITEGTEFITAAITPSNAGNTLLIQVVMSVSNSTGGGNAVALFRDSTANALAAVASSQYGVAGGVQTVVLTHKMAAGTTSSTTFRVRAGPNGAGTLTFNGVASGRIFGGVYASSITVTEIKA